MYLCVCVRYPHGARVCVFLGGFVFSLPFSHITRLCVRLWVWYPPHAARCARGPTGMLDKNLVEESGELHQSAYGALEMDHDPVYKKNLALLRELRGDERYRYLAERVPDGLSKDDVEEYFTLVVRGRCLRAACVLLGVLLSSLCARAACGVECS